MAAHFATLAVLLAAAHIAPARRQNTKTPQQQLYYIQNTATSNCISQGGTSAGGPTLITLSACDNSSISQSPALMFSYSFTSRNLVNDTSCLQSLFASAGDVGPSLSAMPGAPLVLGRCSSKPGAVWTQLPGANMWQNGYGLCLDYITVETDTGVDTIIIRNSCAAVGATPSQVFQLIPAASTLCQDWFDAGNLCEVLTVPVQQPSSLTCDSTLLNNCAETCCAIELLPSIQGSVISDV